MRCRIPMDAGPIRNYLLVCGTLEDPTIDVSLRRTEFRLRATPGPERRNLLVWIPVTTRLRTSNL
jgi:hypothetical protein